MNLLRGRLYSMLLMLIILHCTSFGSDYHAHFSVTRAVAGIACFLHLDGVGSLHFGLSLQNLDLKLFVLLHFQDSIWQTFTFDLQREKDVTLWLISFDIVFAFFVTFIFAIS